MRYILFILSVLFLVPQSLFAQNHGQHSFSVVLDPGHGGKDPGTCGSYSQEKAITLSIAKQVRDKMKKTHPDISVHLTRDRDAFISLEERTQFANDLKSDVFISIHCNHAPTKKANGSEIFVMGLHTSNEHLAVVKRENEAFRESEEVQSSDAVHILQSMFQYNYLNESICLGKCVHDQLNQHTPLRQRGIRQAGFSVLKRALMPGVLLETAFLSNKEDEKYLNSKKGQEEIVDAIIESIIQYKTIQENKAAADLVKEED